MCALRGTVPPHIMLSSFPKHVFLLPPANQPFVASSSRQRSCIHGFFMLVTGSFFLSLCVSLPNQSHYTLTQLMIIALCMDIITLLSSWKNISLALVNVFFMVLRLLVFILTASWYPRVGSVIHSFSHMSFSQWSFNICLLWFLGTNVLFLVVILGMFILLIYFQSKK